MLDLELRLLTTERFNRSRDELVANATSGQTNFDGVTYSTTEEDITGLLQAGSAGVNHGKYFTLISLLFL